MSLKVYGIPTCSTCKKALAWLKQNNIAHEWVNTREAAPTVELIQKWIADLDNKRLRNTSGKSYRALGQEKQEWDDAQWARAFASDAMLLKRPIFTRNNRALMTGFRGSEEILLKTLKD